MAKAASPIRLDKALMAEATLAGATLHRSAAEQVEHWADIGRKVAKIIDPGILLELQAGLVKLNVEKTPSVAVDPDAVFARLDRDRDSGALSDAIAAGNVRYQASMSNPGCLEAVYPDGRIDVGTFVDGEFRIAPTP